MQFIVVSRSQLLVIHYLISLFVLTSNYRQKKWRFIEILSFLFSGHLAYIGECSQMVTHFLLRRIYLGNPSIEKLFFMFDPKVNSLQLLLTGPNSTPATKGFKIRKNSFLVCRLYSCLLIKNSNSSHGLISNFFLIGLAIL